MRVNGQTSSSCPALYKEMLSLHAASVPSTPCFPLHAQTCSNKLTCIQEDCLCPLGIIFSLISCLSPLSLWSFCNQAVSLQTACLLCLLLLVHEFRLVTASILLNNYWYQLPTILPIPHPWKEESVFRLLRLKLLYMTRGFSPFSLYLKKFSIPSLNPPQAGTLFLPVFNFPMLFFFIFGSSRLYLLHLAEAGDQVTLPWN